MYILLGLPGSGKTVQASLLNEKYNIYHIAPGVLLRQLAKEGSNPQLNEMLKTGQLINDGMVAKIIHEEIKKSNSDIFVIEGYPRTMEQITEFKHILQDDEGKFIIKKIIVLDCDPNITSQRLNQRKICNQCPTKIFTMEDEICSHCNMDLTTREDDNPKAIYERTLIQGKYLNEILDYFTQENIEIIKINGNASIENIHDQIVKIININK